MRVRCPWSVLRSPRLAQPRLAALLLPPEVANGEKLPQYLASIIYCNNVLEHLLRPHDAMVSMARLLKPGGMLLLKTQWLWRYHATNSYGDYFRYSPRALEYLCNQAGLNPVWSGYQQMKSGSKKLEFGGAPGKNDVPPVPLPLNTQYPTFVICYKPRRGERIVAFKEVGSTNVATHPRFCARLCPAEVGGGVIRHALHARRTWSQGTRAGRSVIGRADSGGHVHMCKSAHT